MHLIINEYSWSIKNTETSNFHQEINCHWLVKAQWFSPDSLVTSTNKTDSHDIAEILLKVALNTISFHQEIKADI
jgi:hypothetical protein